MTELYNVMGAPRGKVREHVEHANSTLKGPSWPCVRNPKHTCCEANHCGNLPDVINTVEI